MKRRTWLAAGLGGAALVTGGGLSWWRHASVAARPSPEVAALWSLRLPRPEGGDMALAEWQGRPLLVNFWATWCPPCVKELPELDRFAQAQAARGPQGWQVVGIAIDRLPAVQAFLQHTPVRYPLGLAGYAVTELTRQLGNDAGGLPFTVVVDQQGRIAHRKLGPTTEAELQQWAALTPG